MLGANELLGDSRFPDVSSIPSSRGDWIETYSGKKFYVLDPRPQDIELDDVQHALSMLCRFGGHTKKFYSVAEHSINVANRLYFFHGRKLARFGLFHDASEAVLVDIPKPIKPYITNYKEIEKKVQEVMYLKFCGMLPSPIEEDYIKRVDTELLWIEGYQLMKSSTTIWENDGSWQHYYPMCFGHRELDCWDPIQAKKEFSSCFRFHSS